MGESANSIIPINIESELKQSYLDYAMSVIVGRALPDARDGLKPVHRRVLFAMKILGNDWNKSYKKSARIVGDVIGKYHPHGDTAVYDTIVRMAQYFSLRYMLIDGQGNFGSVDGDSAAAMRYTEIRMAKISHALLADLDKETVDFVPNYDGTEYIPDVLPARIPNLLINGSSGIAVGMATNIPPHNLTEVISACLAFIDKPSLSLEEAMTYVPGPDFPTAAIINGREGVIEAYRTGRGRIYLRARSHIEVNDKNNKESIIVTELPYQVNKARLIEKIAELVKLKKIEGITELRDESDKDGMRIVIELRRGEINEVVLNNLFSQTQMQNVFGINVVALVDGQPKLLSLLQLLRVFIDHRKEVVTRRTLFDLRKARNRAHMLEGLAVALANIDPIIQLIRASKTPAEAKEKLLSGTWQLGMVQSMLERAGGGDFRPEDLAPEYGMDGTNYRLSPAQVQAILELRLHRLTALEGDKIIAEYQDLLQVMADLMAILADQTKLMAVIREELSAINQEFGDERKTEIVDKRKNLTLEDLISEENVVVTLSQTGYVKSQSLTLYEAQRRGGRGKSATKVKNEDYVEKLLIVSSHDTIMCFSDQGKVYWLKAFELPQESRASKGRPIVNLLPLAEKERISAILPVRDYEEGKFIFMATAKGTVKKSALIDFSRPRSTGLIAIGLEQDDQLIGVAITDGTKDIMLFNDVGKVIRFNESNVRVMGRAARGVRGIRLGGGQQVISMIVVEENGEILTATKNGFGKRTAIAGYPVRGRGGIGVISIQVTERNGKVVGAVQVCSGDEIMLISDKGTLVRTRVDEVSVVGRNTQGVTLIRLDPRENLVGLQRIDELEKDESDEGSSENAEGFSENAEGSSENAEGSSENAEGSHTGADSSTDEPL